MQLPVTTLQTEAPVIMSRSEYRADFDRRMDTLNQLRLVYQAAVDVMASGTQQEIVNFGKSLAEAVRTSSLMPNGLVAILEEYRECYRAKFGSVQSAPAVPKKVIDAAQAHVDSLTQTKIEEKPAASIEVDGTYTVVFGDDDDYETIRIETIKGGKFDGKVIASFLSGSDNETDFTGFAFVNGKNVKVWSRFPGLAGGRKEEAVRIVLNGTDESRLNGREVYAMKSGRCSRCAHKLTVPASLHRGLGPDCAKRLGLI